jgi:inorganic phosphate transporter, PiT family
VFRLRPVENDCACLVAPMVSLSPTADGTLARHLSVPRIVFAPADTCERLQAPVKVSDSLNMDRLHILSAMAICFARGVNDTPKLVALPMAAHLLDARLSNVLIAVAMGLGGLIFARRVAVTMSQRVTRLDHLQGLAATLITATLVLFASKFGLPVSTTHVSVGSIAGVGASAKTLDWHVLRNIALSWVATLPLAVGIAWMVAFVMHSR